MSSTAELCHRFTIGRFECFALRDDVRPRLRHPFAGSTIGVISDDERIDGLTAKSYPVSRTSVLVRSPETCVLIDPGTSTVARDAGQLQRHLALADTSPDDIGIVVLTHAHLGHAGGALDASGQPAYRGALYALNVEEWEYWMARPDLRSRRLQRMANRIHAHLSVLRNQVTLLHGRAEIVPGIHAIPAPGHSPGHLAISIASEGSELLCLSDTVLAPIHLQHPAWYSRYDLRPEQSVTSRLRLLDRAAATGALVHAYHFPFPGLGWVRQAGRTWRWEPALQEEAAPALHVARTADK